MKKALTILIVVFVGGVVWWIVSNHNDSSLEPATQQQEVNASGVEHSIVLTKEGYVPETVTIQQGDTVVFKNETGKPFWPASNLHPSHRDYPEFDPREPILADETWAFTFREVGEWRFHDHLAPYFNGVIIVEE